MEILLNSGESIEKLYEEAVKIKEAYTKEVLKYYVYLYVRGIQKAMMVTHYTKNLGAYASLYAAIAQIELSDEEVDDTPSQQPQSEEPPIPDDGTQDTQPQTTPMADLNPDLQERKIRVSKNKLIDLIFEHLIEQTHTPNISEDQLVALIAEEAFKQINRKK